MKQISKKEIEVNNVKICYENSIKKIIEYENIFIVLIREKKEIPNNIVAYDYLGNELWKINDIIKARIPRGFYDMEKVSERVIRVNYELGIVYEIDFVAMSILKETYMR